MHLRKVGNRVKFTTEETVITNVLSSVAASSNRRRGIETKDGSYTGEEPQAMPSVHS